MRQWISCWILALSSASAVAAVNLTFTFNDALALQAVSRLDRDGVPSTCASPGSPPAVIAGVNMFSYQTHTFYNNGPARCVNVTLSSQACLDSIAINVFSPSVIPATRSSNWIGDDGTTINKTAIVNFSFNAPANAPIIFWVERGYAVGGPNQANCGYTIQSTELSAVPGTMDVDGNGQVDALTDGLMIIRYLFGLRGNSLINGAVGVGATRTTAAAIEQFLQGVLP